MRRVARTVVYQCFEECSHEGCDAIVSGSLMPNLTEATKSLKRALGSCGWGENNHGDSLCNRHLQEAINK